jgi:flagellar biosynthesis protein FlhB
MLSAIIIIAYIAVAAIIHLELKHADLVDVEDAFPDQPAELLNAVKGVTIFVLAFFWIFVAIADVIMEIIDLFRNDENVDKSK